MMHFMLKGTTTCSGEEERREFEGVNLGNLEVGEGLQQNEMQRASQEEKTQVRLKHQGSSGHVMYQSGWFSGMRRPDTCFEKKRETSSHSLFVYCV